MKKTFLTILLFIVNSLALLSQYDWWGKTPAIGNDGMMEIGKYIDFHESDNHTGNYSLRIFSQDGVLTTLGSQRISGSLLVDDPITTANWSNIWQSGFFQASNVPNAPESGQWFWGLNLGHSSNNPTYKYGGQVLIKNSSLAPTMYFRSTDVNGAGIWAKVIHSYGDQVINGRLVSNGSEINGLQHINGSQLIDDPNYTSDWNSIWQSGFFQAIDASNAPENGQWFWGLNLGHSSNNANYKYGGQILIKNSSISPTMYFRSINVNGTGVWAKVIHSNGNQIIDGKLTTKEVEVKIDVWKDDVFKPTYTLISLEDLEQYIKTNNHLPDVPSEKEIKENGLSLGQSDAVLLQKIEELTLYLIEQNKENKEQSEKIKVLEENKLKVESEVKELKAENTELKKLNNRLLEIEKKIDELKLNK